MSTIISAFQAYAARFAQHVHRATLPNGLRIIAFRNPTSPTFAFYATVPIGSVHEGAERAGLARLCGSALSYGTAFRTFHQIVADTEERGSSIFSGTTQHTTYVGGKALTEDLNLTIRLAAEMLRTPSFPDDEVKRLKQMTLVGLREAEQTPAIQAARMANQAIFPAGHPYHHVASGTPETISGFTRDDLVRFAAGYHPDGGQLVVVGDCDPAAVLAIAAEAFGDWVVAEPHPPVLIPDPAPLNGPQRYTRTMRDKVQSEVFWAAIGPRRNAPDFPAAAAANLILGQNGSGGRLGEEIREQRGLAYAASGNIDVDRGPSVWFASAGVKPAAVEETIAAISAEIARFAADGPTQEEVDETKSYLIGNLGLGLDSNDGILSILSLIDYYELGDDYLDRYPAKVEALDREQIAAAAARYLDPARAVIAVAGPAAPSEATGEQA